MVFLARISRISRFWFFGGDQMRAVRRADDGRQRADAGVGGRICILRNLRVYLGVEFEVETFF